MYGVLIVTITILWDPIINTRGNVKVLSLIIGKINLALLSFNYNLPIQRINARGNVIVELRSSS